MTTTLDQVAKAFGFNEKTLNDTHVIGTVKKVNSDRSYQVALNTSSTTARCMAFCDAVVGDRVMVLVLKNGSCAAIAKAR